MKRKILLTAIMASLLVCFLAAPAHAYFTANTQAEGGMKIKPVETYPKEDIVDREKILTVYNDKDAAPVYIRARGFSGDDADLEYTGGEGWIDGGDGWWYYEPILQPGEHTTQLIVNISKVLPDGAEVGDNFNIVVVYEAIRLVDGAEGARDAYAKYLAQEGDEQ